MAQHRQAFVLDKVLNICKIVTHFGAFIDELLLQLNEELWCIISVTFTLHASLSG